MQYMILMASVFGSDSTPEIPKLSVSGNYVVKKEPDKAIIRLGVEEEDKNAEEALKKTAAKIASIIASLKPQLGKGSITTETISLYPIYEQAEPKMHKAPLTIGYRASSSLTIKTNDLAITGKLIDLSSKSGANKIESLTFSLEDERQAKEEALTIATQNAIASAKTLAKAADIRLKRLLSLQEDSGRNPVPYKTAYFARGAMMENSFPVEPGEVEISASVSLTYEIE